ncbi:MAG: permease-like cell division protein FtsX [Candidatus Aenigmarchaeota archaeon]|nr:permease-like cell division protein FtsX [Candidatus Aenigmarchaeota archaeon]
MFINFKRIIKFAGQDFLRNFWLSSITIIILIMAFFSISLLITLNIVLKQSISAIEKKVDISLYLEPNIDQEKINNLKNQLLVCPGIEEIKYISAEESLTEFRSEHQDKPLIIESLDELTNNPLGATLVIKAKSINDYFTILNYVNNLPEQELIQHKDYLQHKILIQQLNKISYHLVYFGLIISSIFILISILFVFNLIRLSIYTRRKEIEIMHLVGATDWFIRLPYLVEGLIHITIAWIISFLFFTLFWQWLFPYLNIFLEISNDLSATAFLQRYFGLIFGIEILGFFLLNILSSGVAVDKYLK